MTEIAVKNDLNEDLQYQEQAARVSRHPCYSSEAHFKFGRIHVPVAKKCNIQCGYCVRKYDCPNENRPGVTTQVINPEEALVTIRQALIKEPRIKVLGIAGPGEPLANAATLETLKLAHREFPELTKCTSTNGLALPETVEALDQAGVIALTITINAVDPDIGGQIYPFVRYKGKTYQDREAFEVLSRNQLEGLREAARRGMVVKINSVLIPGINDTHLEKVARVVKDLGAHVMNIMPLIAQGKFKDITPPTPEELGQVRDRCAAILNQFRNCNQCRADAVGVPGEEDCGGRGNTDQCSGKFLQEKQFIKLESLRKKL